MLASLLQHCHQQLARLGSMSVACPLLRWLWSVLWQNMHESAGELRVMCSGPQFSECKAVRSVVRVPACVYTTCCVCCREGRVTEAMQFAQSVMAGLKSGAAHSDSQLRVSNCCSLASSAYIDAVVVSVHTSC